MDCIILCGGLGTRIRTVTGDSYPKTMVEIAGKTILEWEMNWLRKYGITHIILAVRHLAEYIQEQFGETLQTEYGQIDISYSKEKEKLGSGGATKLASKFVNSDDVIIMNGDVMTNYNLANMIEDYNNANLKGSIAVALMRSPFGIVEINENEKIKEFKEKPLLNHWIHAGVDIFKTKTLEEFPTVGQMEETIFVKLANENQLKAYKIEPKYFWRSIDNPKDLQEAEKEWEGLERIK